MPAEPRIVLVDYGAGNLRSVGKALERAGLDVRVSPDPDAVRRADAVVLPGVGAFADCMCGLEAVAGMREALEQAVRRKARPFLGICVGMQLMATRGLEFETVDGLGWIPGEVRAIQPADPALKIPHMGWNTLELRRAHPLFEGIETGPDGLHAYFVHSYQLVPAEAADLIAVTDYGGPLTAVVGRDNMAGTQFHPEKSQTLGLHLIGNFLEWKP